MDFRDADGSGPHSQGHADDRAALCIVMVGLPARGKSYLSHKIANFFSWMGVGGRIFNVGNYRRKQVSGQQSAAFFSSSTSFSIWMKSSSATDSGEEKST